jgi:serine protease Do
MGSKPIMPLFFRSRRLRSFPGRRFSVLLAGLSTWLAAAPVWAESNAALGLQERITTLFAEHGDAVVRVKAAFEEIDDEGEAEVTVKYGTGFFISRQGHILANASRTDGADRIWIEHGGLSLQALSLGQDFATNLALLKVTHLPPNFGFIPLPDRSDLPPIGSMIVMISCPLEFEPSPYLGLVAGHESSFFQTAFPTTYIRTSIAAGLGEGGAPILDLNGRLVGIVIAGLAEVRGAYCLPGAAARRVRDDLLFEGEVRYGWFGFDVITRGSRTYGPEILIENVVEGGPSEAAGLREGDVLVAIDGYEVRTISSLRDAVFFSRVGEFASVEVLRGPERTEVELSIRIAERPVDTEFVRAIAGSEEDAAEASPDGDS